MCFQHLKGVDLKCKSETSPGIVDYKTRFGPFQRPLDEWTLEFRGLLIQFFGDEKETQFPNESNPNDGCPYGGATGKGASTNGVTRPGV